MPRPPMPPGSWVRTDFDLEISVAVPNRPRPDRIATFVAGSLAHHTDPWTVSGVIAGVDDHLVISELEVWAGSGQVGPDDPRGVTSTTLRAVPVGRILDAARQTLIDEARVWRFIGRDPDREPASRLAAAMAHAGEPRRGRKGLGDEHYRRIAIEYLELQKTHPSRGLLDELAAREGRPRETIRDWVKRARDLEYLSPARPGRAGAEPGPRLTTEQQQSKGRKR